MMNRIELNKIRKEALEKIKGILGDLDDLELKDICCGTELPVIQQSCDLCDTFTLDMISRDVDASLIFKGSSTSESKYFEEVMVSTDALLDIVDFLEEDIHRIALNKLKNGGKNEPKKKKPFIDRYAYLDKLPLDMRKKEIYDRLCSELTNYECPNDCCTQAEAARDLYEIGVVIQNHWDELLSPIE